MSIKTDNSDKYLTEKELRSLLYIIDELEDKTLIMFTLETGLRRSEVVSIEIDNIDFEKQVVRVFDEKKDVWRKVVFPQHAGAQIRMCLKAREKHSPFLFPFSDRTANRKLKRWCEKAGIRVDKQGKTEVSFHWLRHTFIRRSKMVSRDIKVVQQNTGDTIETILRYYRDLSIEDRVHEMEAKPILPL